MQSVYNFWLGLIPQFFGQLGAGMPTGANGAAGAAPGLSFPADQVARAAAMTQDALQGLSNAYAPLLQASGTPGLLGQWAAALPEFPGMPSGDAARAASAMFNPWLAAMPFMAGANANPASPPPATPTAQPFNPWAAMTPFLPGAQAAPGAAAATAANPAMMPLQAMQQAWADMGSRMSGTTTQSVATAFDRTFGGLFDALGMGPMRRLQSAWQELTAAGIAQNEARVAYAMVVQGAFATGLDTLHRRLADKAEAGERVDSMLALLRLWALATEEAVHEVLQAERGLAVTAALARAGVTYRRKMQAVAAIIADSLDMATRSDLDDAYREIQALKRELRARRPPVVPAAPRTGSRRKGAKR